MAIIKTFSVGYCTHLACMAIRGAARKTCRFPAQVFLIEANGHFWLWDTGYAHHFYDATRSGVYALYPKITPVYFQSHQAIIKQLQQIGLTERDIQAVILSHFHADHIAGVKDFPNTSLICSQQAWQRLRPLSGIRALRQGYLPTLLPHDFEQKSQFFEHFPIIRLPETLAPFEHGHVLPNSGQEVIFVPLAGHAVGQFGAFVQTDAGWVLLAADAAWSQANYRGRPPSRLSYLIMDSPRQFYQTLNQLKQLDEKGIPIYLSHEVWGGSILDSIE